MKAKNCFKKFTKKEKEILQEICEVLNLYLDHQTGEIQDPEYDWYNEGDSHKDRSLREYPTFVYIINHLVSCGYGQGKIDGRNEVARKFKELFAP